MKTCKIEGCTNKCWGHGLCVKHSPKTPLKKVMRSPTINYKPKDEESINLMREFFLRVWKKRKHYSEISGEKLYGLSSAYFHHILYKERYKEAMYDEDNIILLTIEEHQNSHSDPHRYEEINKRREELLKKYSNQID
jgi:hypothetical protein